MSETIVSIADEEDDCLLINEEIDPNIPCSSKTAMQSKTASGSTRRRPRKSVLSVKPNIEMQFEWIPDEGATTSDKAISPKKQEENILNILNDSDTLCENVVKRKEIKTLVQEIAEERVRINYLLAASNLPEIKFSLYMDYAELEKEFMERLRNQQQQEQEQEQQQKDDETQ